jgi:hypothetical protein
MCLPPSITVSSNHEQPRTRVQRPVERQALPPMARLSLVALLVLGAVGGVVTAEVPVGFSVVRRLISAFGINILAPVQPGGRGKGANVPSKDFFVIGAGFGRMATSSLQMALDQLGFGSTYHMKVQAGC